MIVACAGGRVCVCVCGWLSALVLECLAFLCSTHRLYRRGRLVDAISLLMVWLSTRLLDERDTTVSRTRASTAGAVNVSGHSESPFQ